MAVSEGFANFLTRGQALLESLFPGVLVWDGNTYMCASSGARGSDELEVGGFVDTGTRNVRVLKDSMSTPPAVGTRVVLDDLQVRVTEVGEREWDVAWHLQCEPIRGE